MGNSKEKKNKGKSINAFIIVFGVIVACYILSFFISPGAFEREVVGGRTIVVPNFPGNSKRTGGFCRNDVPGNVSCRLYRSL